MSSRPLVLLGFALPVMWEGSVRRSSSSTRYTQPRSRTVGVLRSRVAMPSVASFAWTLSLAPGRKLACSRCARGPSRRSRLAGWT